MFTFKIRKSIGGGLLAKLAPGCIYWILNVCLCTQILHVKVKFFQRVPTSCKWFASLTLLKIILLNPSWVNRYLTTWVCYRNGNKGGLKSLLERLVLVKSLANHWQLDFRARHYVCRICAQNLIRIDVIVMKTVYVKAKLNFFENLFAFWPQPIKHCNACCRKMFVYRDYCAFATYCLPAKKKQNKIKQNRQTKVDNGWQW